MGWGERAQCNGSNFPVCEGWSCRIEKPVSSLAHNADQTGRETKKVRVRQTSSVSSPPLEVSYSELLSYCCFWHRRGLSWTARIWPKKAPLWKARGFGFLCVFSVVLLLRILLSRKQVQWQPLLSPSYLAVGGSKKEDPHLLQNEKWTVYQWHSFSASFWFWRQGLV